MKSTNWNNWGHLADRYQSKRSRKILALDGGGIHGLMTARALIRLEELLAAGRGGSGFRLCHYFDYIGGTSTGAIIAAALSRGISAQAFLKGLSSIKITNLRASQPSMTWGCNKAA